MPVLIQSFLFNFIFLKHSQLKQLVFFFFLLLLVLVLFGILPAAMSWSDRYSASSPSINLPQLVPGGKITLSIILGGAGYVVFSELLEKLGHPWVSRFLLYYSFDTKYQDFVCIILLIIISIKIVKSFSR